MRKRVPVVHQMTAAECGAACLSMILGYHGRATRVPEAREALGVGRDGVTALAIVRAARRYDLQTKAYSLAAADIDAVSLPAIAHWNGNHFVVVEECTGSHVHIVDPSRGRLRLTREQFAHGFVGVAITFSPSGSFATRSSGARVERARFLGHLVRTPGVPRTLSYIVVASFLLQALGLAVPLLTKVVVDNVLPAQRVGLLSLLGLGMGAVVLAQGVSSFIRAHLLVRLQAKLDARLMCSFFQHLLALPYRFFQERTSGDLMARMNGNTVLRQVVTGQMVSVVLDSVMLVLAGAALLVLTPAFGLAVLACGAVQAGVMLGAASRTQALLQAELASHADAYGFTAETLKGIAGLKASGSEDHALSRWGALYDGYLSASMERGRYGATIDALMSVVRGGAPVLLLLVGAHAVLSGSMTLGTMLAASAIAATFLGPLASLVTTGQQVQLASAHFERLADVFSATTEPRRDGDGAEHRISGTIELRDVGFRYAAGSPWVFRHVNLTITAGEKLALVGRTGSGKSTLAAMLLFLYEPTEGEILFDGRPGSALDYTSLRRQFGVVLQESFMLSGSIRSNVAFHCPDLSLERVIAACRTAGVHDDIVALPMGYETRLAEAGSGLSGGQRQRLALARALASEPTVLLLDEATSHLDAITEARVDENLSALSCTRIVIAHRLSTVRNADRIVVIDGGEIVESGTHQVLLDRAGVYAALVGSSALGAITGDDGQEGTLKQGLPASSREAVFP